MRTTYARRAVAACLKLGPAVEDLWGAGAVITALAGLGVTGLTPEARPAAAAFSAVAANLAAELADSTSGRELAGSGFGSDLAVAADLDVSASAPLLANGRFVDAANRHRSTAPVGAADSLT